MNSKNRILIQHAAHIAQTSLSPADYNIARVLLPYLKRIRLCFAEDFLITNPINEELRSIGSEFQEVAKELIRLYARSENESLQLACSAGAIHCARVSGMITLELETETRELPNP